MNVREIRELAKILKENQLESIEYVGVDFTLRMKMPTAQASLPAPSPTAVVAAEPLASSAAPATPTAPGTVIASPMVGVFYAAPSPDAEPYVSVGSRVKKGDTLCIIEAMKLMNEIAVEQDGEITEILVENAQVVEFSQPLFRIR